MRYELNKVNGRDNLRMRFLVRGKFVLPVSCFYVSNTSNPSVSLKLSTDNVLFFVLPSHLSPFVSMCVLTCGIKMFK